MRAGAWVVPRQNVGHALGGGGRAGRLVPSPCSHINSSNKKLGLPQSSCQPSTCSESGLQWLPTCCHIPPPTAGAATFLATAMGKHARIVPDTSAGLTASSYLAVTYCRGQCMMVMGQARRQCGATRAGRGDQGCRGSILATRPIGPRQTLGDTLEAL